MHRITTKYPEDPRAPFYNSQSDKMTPLAKLYIRREKVIARNCDDEILQAQIVEVSENGDDEANNIRELMSIAHITRQRKYIVCMACLRGNYRDFA